MTFAHIIESLRQTGLDAVLRPGVQTRYGEMFAVLDHDGRVWTFEAVPAKHGDRLYTEVMTMGESKRKGGA